LADADKVREGMSFASLGAKNRKFWAEKGGEECGTDWRRGGCSGCGGEPLFVDDESDIDIDELLQLQKTQRPKETEMTDENGGGNNGSNTFKRDDYEDEMEVLNDRFRYVTDIMHIDIIVIQFHLLFLSIHSL
jgi:hypothetical protein